MHDDGKSTANPAVAAGELRPEDHVQFLDYIRGIAILSVFVFHGLDGTFADDQLPGWHTWFRSFEMPASFPQALPWYYGQIGAAAHGFWLQLLALLPATIGFNGVAIFFVVSGFCIHLSYQRSKKHGFKEFFWRRFFRIYPVYLAALLLFAFIDPSTRVDIRTTQGMIQFFSHLFLVQNFLGTPYYFGINGVFWSIAVEMQLYVLYPLLLWLVSRKGWKGTLWVTGAIEITLRLLWSIWGIKLHLPFAWWFSWTIGAKIADDWMNKRPIFLAKCPLWIWPLATVVCWFVTPLFIFSFPAAALATGAIVGYLLTHRHVRLPVPAIISEQVRLAGVMSYSIYLLHFPIVRRVTNILAKVLPNVHFPPLAVYGFCMLSWFLILIPSWLFYRFGEVPSIEFGKAFVKKRRRTTTAPAIKPPQVLPN